MSTRRQREKRWAFMEAVEKERQKAENANGSEEPKKPRKRGTPAKRSKK